MVHSLFLPWVLYDATASATFCLWSISVLCLVRCFFCWSSSVSSIFLPLCTLSIFLSKIQRQGKACMPEISSPIFLPWCTRSFFRQLQYSEAEKLPEILLSFSLVQENHTSCCYLYLGTILISFFNSLLVWNCFLYSSDETETSGLNFLCPTLNVQHPQMETSPIGMLTMISPTQQCWASNC